MRLGIDVGSSYIKIVSLGENGIVLSRVMERSKDIALTVPPLARRAADMAGELPYDVYVTGVGAAAVPAEVLGVEIQIIPEFQAIAVGALHKIDITEAVVISMGTGSALVHSARGRLKHLGGSGVGGGTIEGLTAALLGTREFNEINELSKRGVLKNVDLLIEDVATQEIPGLPGHITASNLAKLSADSASCDIAAGLLNFVYQTIGTLGVFECRSLGINDVVLTGSVAEFDLAPVALGGLTELYGTHFTIPPYPAFRTALGAILGAEH